MTFPSKHVPFRDDHVVPNCCRVVKSAPSRVPLDGGVEVGSLGWCLAFIMDASSASQRRTSSTPRFATELACGSRKMMKNGVACQKMETFIANCFGAGIGHPSASARIRESTHGEEHVEAHAPKLSPDHAEPLSPAPSKFYSSSKGSGGGEDRGASKKSSFL